MGRKKDKTAGCGRSEPRRSSGLRAQAEKSLAEKGLAGMHPADMERLVHELQVHQIELEMQNEELQRAQSEIAESHEKYVDLYDFAPVGYFSFDRNGVILEANLTGASLLGIERSRLVGKPFFLCLSPPHRDTFFNHCRRAHETPPAESCELLIQRKDGSLVSVLMESVAVADKTEEVTVHSAVTDITERRRMEEALRESRDRLERRVHERTAELEKTYLAVETEVTERRQAEAALRETNRLLKLHAVRSSKKEYFDGVVALLREWTSCEGAGIRVLDKEENIPYESYAGFSKGFWESENFLSMRRDQCACIRVARGTPEPQDMACMRPCGSFHCEDTRAFLAGLSTEGAERFRGRCITEGYASVTIIPISYRNRILGAIHLADRTKAKIPGKTVEFIESVQPLIGEAIYGLAVEEERTLLGQELRQSQKMEAIGTLSGGIAHDFNNMLAAIMGFSELALQELPAESPVRRHLAQVFHAGERAKDLVKQILLFSRKGEEERKPIHLLPIVEETVRMLRASLPTTIEIHQHNAGDPLVLADPGQMQQVIMNLCTNAGYAMRKEGGVLDVELSDFTLAPPEGKSPAPAGAYLSLSIADSGTGMDSTTLERIFDPFFTTKQRGEGTGLGLSVVHGIVKSHGGTITVTSTPGVGSRFQVLLPSIKECGLPADTEPLVESRGEGHVLVVDDEDTLIEMEKEMLKGFGYSVTTAHDSATALSLFKENPERYHAVLTDQTMPGMTGIELARELISIKPDIPIILVTGYSEMVHADSAGAAGVKMFVMKPFTKAELARTIQQVLAEKKDR